MRMRCTKHVFDLKVLLFIFLVESDPNFCGAVLAVAGLGCSASLSTCRHVGSALRWCSLLREGSYLLVPSPYREVSLQMVGSIISKKNLDTCQ